MKKSHSLVTIALTAFTASLVSMQTMANSTFEKPKPSSIFSSVSKNGACGKPIEKKSILTQSKATTSKNCDKPHTAEKKH